MRLSFPFCEARPRPAQTSASQTLSRWQVFMGHGLWVWPWDWGVRDERLRWPGPQDVHPPTPILDCPIFNLDLQHISPNLAMIATSPFWLLSLQRQALSEMWPFSRGLHPSRLHCTQAAGEATSAPLGDGSEDSQVRAVTLPLGLPFQP